jgi:polar amino acid transport system substrate-binding protein
MSSNERRRFLRAAGALALAGLIPSATAAAAELELQQPGTLRVAVYANFPPYSAAGKGVDVALGRALAEHLGLQPQIVEFPADEDMKDDLRNMVWRGHYLGAKPGDVMLHVPVDNHFATINPQVHIFGPYHLETLAMARLPDRVPPPSNSVNETFEIFTTEKIGVEIDTHSSDFLLHILGGQLQPNIVHFPSLAAAVDAMRRGDVAAAMGTRTELEGAIGAATDIKLDPLSMPELRIRPWPLGMAVKKEHGNLANALSAALGDLQRSGALAKIFADHGISHRLP